MHYRLLITGGSGEAWTDERGIVVRAVLCLGEQRLVVERNNDYGETLLTIQAELARRGFDFQWEPAADTRSSLSVENRTN